MSTPANPDDLLAFVRAQLDDDEATTRELLYWAQQTILTLQDPKLLGKHIPGWHDWPKVERMCRVRLAEVDAKRRILDLYEPTLFGDLTRLSTLEEVIGLMALPFADRPGFREEWRP